jgi:hypothetical protein
MCSVWLSEIKKDNRIRIEDFCDDSDEETALQFSNSSHRDPDDEDSASLTESDDDNIAGNRNVLDDSLRESF